MQALIKAEAMIDLECERCCNEIKKGDVVFISIYQFRILPLEDIPRLHGDFLCESCATQKKK